MIYFRSFCFFIWFSVYLTFIDVAITNADVGNLETLPSTAGASTGLKRNNMSIHAVQKREFFRKSSCYTNACRDTVSKIHKNMNENLKPCEDFYKFSCDNFQKSFPKFIQNVDAKSIIANNRIEQLRNIIEKESPPNEPRPHRLARDFYKACMKENIILEDGLKSLLRNFKELGGWPVLEGDTWNESDFHWADSVSKFRKLGYSINYFINFDVIDSYQSGKTVRPKLRLGPPTFDFPRSDIINDLDLDDLNTDFFKEYYKYMVDMAVFIGADRNRAKSELRKSLKFELELARISHNAKALHNNEEHHEITVDRLRTYYESSVEWLRELNIILAPQVQLKKDDIVIETAPFYLSEMGELISKTSKRVLANYAFWRAFNEAADYIKKPDLMRWKKNFYEEGYIFSFDNICKWKKCVRLVSDHLDFSVVSMELNQYERKAVVEIARYIKDAFRKILKQVKWMDKKTRKRALTKLHNLRSYISYPDKYANITELDKFYEDLELNSNNPFGNKLNMTIFETNRMLDLLNEDSMSEWWRSYLKPMELTAMHIPRRNSIIIPAGLLQDPLFNISRPYFMKYGSIGSIIGHEITHAFNGNLRYIYKEGKQMNWWDPSTLINYKSEEECLIRHYGQYRLKNISMNLYGLRTLNEDAADMGGVKAAYYAYQKWDRENGFENLLSGLYYSTSQLFWISYAQQWCGKYDREKRIQLMIEDTHSLSKYRVNAVLSNIKEFSQDFNCKIGSRMNPLRKCNMW